MSKNIEQIRDFTFYGCSSLKSIIIPEGVRSIGEQVFYDCSSLEAIDFPSSLSRSYGYNYVIPDYSNINANNLRIVICRTSYIPDLKNDRYWDTNYKKTLYVPEELIESYKKQEYNWGPEFFDLYLPLEDAPDVSIEIPGNEGPDNPGNGDNDNPDNGDSGSIVSIEDYNDGTTIIIYDLSGRKLSNVKDIKELTPGFYIINGKTYLLK